MRILQLRFQNLNSLVGEWLIDLSHQAFVADGIFAITGPTGAGKSTILDAMCLALYGRTPRLKNISKSSNEIMSRQTGECFAEIIFETNTGKYRCHWSQHRARKKAEGDLQSPKHEIADETTGKVIESKIRAVAEKIEQATGMDFDRFTRSMLLAQGGFAAFLQADPDQRAPILEQITGTEIYSQISVKVHELRAEQNKKLDLLMAELAGMQILSEEDEKQLTDELTEKTKNNDVLVEQLKQKNAAIGWLEGLANSEAELQLLHQQQQELVIRQQAFQPELEKLERANHALELSADYAGITAMRNEQQRSQHLLMSNQHSLPEFDKQNVLAIQELDLATTTLAEIKNNQKQAQSSIKKARELDLKIQEKQTPIKNAQEVINAHQQQYEKLTIQQQDDKKALQNNQAKLSDLTDLLAQHKTDEGLIEQLEKIRNQFKSLAELAGQQQQKKTQLADAELKKLETAQVWQAQAHLLAHQQKEFEQLEAHVKQYQQQLAEQLDSRSLTEWRQDLNVLAERKMLLEKSQLAMQSLVEFKQRLNKLTENQTLLNATELDLTQEFNHKTEAMSGLEREIALLETQYDLQKKIESYEEARQYLHDGEPCPLCGANEHPYAQGNIPVLNDTLSRLTTTKSDLKLSSVNLANLRIKLAETQKDKQQNSLHQQEMNTKIKDEEGLLVGLYSKLAMAGEVTDSLLTDSLLDNDIKFKRVTSIVSNAEMVEQKIVGEREALDKKRDELTAVDKQLQQLNHTKLNAEQAVERLAEELANITAGLQTTQLAIMADVAIYGVEELTVETSDEILQQLTARREQWRAWQKDKSIIEPLISGLNSQIKHQAEQLTKLESDLNIQQRTYRQLESDCAALSQERITLFADKNPDIEEARLSHLVEQAENNLNLVRQKAQKAEQALTNLKHKIETLLHDIAERTEQLSSAETSFRQRLLISGFNDEQTYKAACLSDEMRKALQEQAQQLINEHNALLTRIDDKTTHLAKEREKQITQQSLLELKERVETLNLNVSNLQQAMGAIRQKLNGNNEIRLQQQSRIEQIDAQKRECSRWNTLHELIGSADGKKYRNFAQGLTFEMMIGHANRQLQKMTDRYLLIRDQLQPLELSVVDNYQAGETRSTKNLSGGESFIVSLSLALGLSQMASKNVRVDSLFLDEGFGTLDEEALDTALETLSGLQQEGKLIGVISHVQVLKERISTQIQISPSSGGRSIISGPGISRLNG